MNPRHRTTAVFFAVATVALSVLGLFGLPALLGNAPIVHAAPTYQINYQGKLTNSSNAAVADGTYVIRFRIYDASSGGTTLFDETQSVTLTNGLFSVMLGSASTTVLETLNWNEPTYLGVTVSGDSEMTPRKVIGTVPNAFDSSRVGGVASSSFLRADASNSTSTASTFVTFAQSGAGKIMELLGQGSASVLSVLSTGKVGISSSTPTYELSVEGTSSLGNNARVGYFTATTTTASTFPYASSTALTVSGNVFTPVLSTLSGNASYESVGSVKVYLDTDADGTETFSVCTDSDHTAGLQTCNVVITEAGRVGASYFTSDGSTASTFPYASTTALTVSGALLVNNASSTITNLVTVNATSTNATSTNFYISGQTRLASLSGVLKATGGVISAALAGTDYLASYDAWTHPATGISATTSALLINNATSTITNLVTVNATSTNATTTRLSISDTGLSPVLNIGWGSGQQYGIMDLIYANRTTDGLRIGTTGTYPISLIQNGGTALYIDTSKRVGIGTTSPSALLAVHGNAYISSGLFVGGNIVSTSTTASVFPYASTTALTVSGALLVNNASSTITNLVTVNATSTNATTTNLYVSGRSTLIGNVGVGTTTPFATLAVNPIAGAASNQFVVGSSTATNFIIDNAGRIGIGGTTTPAAGNLVDILSSTSGDWDNALAIDHRNDANEDNTAMSIINTANTGTVNSSAVSRNLSSFYNSFTPTLTLGGTADASLYATNQSLSLSSVAFGDSGSFFSSNSDLSVYGGNASISGNITYNDTADVTKQTLSIYGSNVDISSGLTITSISAGNANTLNSYAGRFSNAQTSPGNADLTATSYGVYGSATGNLTTTGTTEHYGGYFITSGSADTNYGLYTTASGATTNNYGIYSAAGTNYFSGNVGIATATPGTTLSVQGKGLFADNLNTSYFVATSTISSILPYASSTSLTVSGTSYFGDGTVGQGSWDTSGFFSVGTTSRSTTRSVVFSDPVHGYADLTLIDPTAANYSSITKGGIYIRFNEGLLTFQGMRPDNGNGGGVTLTIDQTTGFIGSGTTTPMAFFAASTTATKDSKYAGAFVSQTGYGLYVEGKSGNAANFQGNIDITGKCSDTSTGCADVAEEYPSSEPMEPGDIAMIDVNTNKTVRKADSANRESLIGIVATAPGVVLTDEGPVRLGGATLDPAHKPAIALVGRVPTKVSLEGGNIKPGDRISISSLRGVGMRATSTGTVVGVALEAFDSNSDNVNGVGSILVYVNLSYYHLDSKIAQGVIEGSYWILDEKTGSIKALGPVDLNNFPILNVKAIQSASGKWRIDENGTLVVEDLEVHGQATIGTPDNRTGITLFDQQTGSPYCLHIAGGSVSTSAGACTVEDTATSPTSTGGGNAGGGADTTSSSTDAGGGGDTTTDTASTTDTGGGDVAPPVDDEGGSSGQEDAPPSSEGDATSPSETSPEVTPPEPTATPPETSPEPTPAETPPAPAADTGTSSG